LFQFLGALIAGGLNQIFRYYFDLEKFKTSNIEEIPHMDLKHWNIPIGWLCEMFGTMILIFMYYLLYLNKRTRSGSWSWSFGIGSVYGIMVLAIGPITGACLNPWKVLGPAIISRELFQGSYNYAYIYYCGGPIVGVLCGYYWRWIFMEKEEKIESKTD